MILNSFFSPAFSTPFQSGWHEPQDLPAAPPANFTSLKRALPRSSGKCFAAKAPVKSRLSAASDSNVIFNVFIFSPAFPADYNKKDEPETRKRTHHVSRLIAKLRGRGLIAKVKNAR